MNENYNTKTLLFFFGPKRLEIFFGQQYYTHKRWVAAALRTKEYLIAVVTSDVMFYIYLTALHTLRWAAADANTGGCLATAVTKKGDARDSLYFAGTAHMVV